MKTNEFRSRLYAAVALLGVLSLSIALLNGFYVASYEGVDENGCMGTARRLAVHGDPAKRTSDPYEYVSENVVQVGENVFYAKYPIGYPALCALAYKLAGSDAAFLVNPVLAVLAVAGIFFLGRAMFGNIVGAFAAILLTVNPLTAFYGLSARTHTGALCFAVWGMFFVWRWAERGGWANAALAGAVTAYASTVRYTEALLVLPVCAMVVWRSVEQRRKTAVDQRRTMCRQIVNEVLVMAAAALVTVTPLLIHHYVAYGAPWRTGYALCGEDTGFGWAWFKANWELMLTRLDTGALFLIFPVGLAGICSLIGQQPKRGSFLASWAFPSILLYTAYYWAPQGEGPSYMRFFLSVFPALILGAFGVLCPPERLRPWTSVCVGCFVGVVAVWNLQAGQLLPNLEMQRDRLLRDKIMTDLVRRNVPSGSVILATGSTLNTVEYAGDYHLYSQQVFTRDWVRRRLSVLKDNDPHPFQRDKALALERLLGDKTDAQLAGLQREVLAQHLAAERAVAVICTKAEFGIWRGRLGDQFKWKPIAEWVEVQNASTAGLLPKPQCTSWGLYSVTLR